MCRIRVRTGCRWGHPIIRCVPSSRHRFRLHSVPCPVVAPAVSITRAVVCRLEVVLLKRAIFDGRRRLAARLSYHFRQVAGRRSRRHRPQPVRSVTRSRRSSSARPTKLSGRNHALTRSVMPTIVETIATRPVSRSAGRRSAFPATRRPLERAAGSSARPDAMAARELPGSEESRPVRRVRARA